MSDVSLSSRTARDGSETTADLLPIQGAGVWYKWTLAGLKAWLNGQLSFLSNSVPVPILSGGTGATTAGAARTALGLAIGSVVQAWSSTLDAVAAASQITLTNAGIGFLANSGVGAAALQSTSKATAVTCNTVTGKITMSGVALAAATQVTFTVSNTAILAGDNIIVNHASAGTAGAYSARAGGIVAGTSFGITVKNESAASLSEAIVLNYTIIRGSSN